MSKYFDLFAHRGYLDVTMREVAMELGVSTGTLYHYFPTKKDLLEALFHLASRRDASEVIARITEDTPLEMRLKIFFDFVLEKESYFQDIVLLTIDYCRYQDSHEYFDIITEADGYYGNAIASGLGLEAKYGFMVATFLNGLVYHRLVFPGSLSYEQQAKLFQEMMLCYFQQG